MRNDPAGGRRTPLQSLWHAHSSKPARSDRLAGNTAGHGTASSTRTSETSTVALTTRLRTTSRGVLQAVHARLPGWLSRRDWTFWLLLGIALLALVPRLYGLNWDANNHLHPDERQIDFVAQCLTLPGTPRPGGCPAAYDGLGWLLSPNSPLNPHFFAYGSFPLYMLAGVVHLLAWLTTATSGHFAPPDGGAWDDFNHFTLVGRVLSAGFDAGSVLLIGLLARRLVRGSVGGYVALLAAAFVAVIPFNIQVSHFYAVDTPLLFFVLLTLLGCVLLAQGGAAEARGTMGIGPTPLRATAGNAGSANSQTSTPWRSYAVAFFTGAAFALALATKVSALPLLAPLAVALLLRWRRRGFEDAVVAALCVAVAALATFLITSPYAIIDFPTFQQQVGEQTALSQGKLDYPYVRQFANTTPYVYEIVQMLLYDMGLPLGLLGLAGFGWAAARLWRSLDDDWAILVVWIAGYFAVVGGAYTKFTRYMLPEFAPLALCGAAALGALAVWGYRRLVASTASTGTTTAGEENLAPTGAAADSPPPQHTDSRISAPPPVREGVGGEVLRRLTGLWGPRWWTVVCAALGLTVFATTLVSALALVNIYAAPNTRVAASEWIYDHIPAGATVTNEIWDDALPIEVPAARSVNGVPETHAGYLIDPGQYKPLGLDLYAEDTPEKATTLAQQLASADVVVISSQRLLRSIPKLPDRYPMTTRYYQLLFAGKLGFQLAAHIEAHPHLLGYTLDDTNADESFSVYDHPPVWIFTRSGTPLTAEQIHDALTAGVRLPAASQRPGSMPSLLLDPKAVAADNASAPLGIQFPANSLPNQIPLIWWLVAVELLGLVTFPLAFFAFPGLRDRGWGLAKLLGLLVLAYLVWLPSSLELLPFDHWVVVAAFGVLATTGLAVGWRARARLLAFARARWKLLVIGEAAFLAAFLFFALIRGLDPDLWHIWRGGEKPMELAFLDGILRSRYMPPADPWFAGGSINYYYYGQFLIAVLIKLTGIAPATAFNLAIPLLFALTFSAAFSVVAGLTGRAWAGLAAGFGLVVLGNLDGLWQLVGQWHAMIAGQPVPPFDYWESSRVIPCLGVTSTPENPCSATTINEFPYWSFLYADLHAHLIDLPVTVMILGCCASLLATARAQAHRWLPTLPTLAVAAVALGAAWCINTWDLPTYAGLFVAILALRILPMRGGWRALLDALRQDGWPLLRDFAVVVALVMGAAYALYAPFHSHFLNFVSGIGTVTTPTAPYQFFVLFGVYLFLAASFVIVELHDRAEGWSAALTARGELPWLPDGFRGPFVVAGTALVLLLAFLLSLKLFFVILLAAGLWLALGTRHKPLKLFTYALLLLGLGVALGVELVYVRDFLDNSPYERMNTVFKFYYQVWTLLALGGALAFVFLVQRLWTSPATPSSMRRGAVKRGFVSEGIREAAPAGREAVGSGFEAPGMLAAPLRALARLVSPLIGDGAASHRQSRHGAPPLVEEGVEDGVTEGFSFVRGAWMGLLILLVFGSCIFLVEGTNARLQDPQLWAQVQPPPGGLQPQGLSLDGMAYMRGWYPGDYAAITWLNTHIEGIPTIVESSTGVYNWQGRVSVYTGLPDVIQLGHESEQRYSSAQPYGDQVGTRQQDVEAFWSTDDPAAAKAFLREYHVQLVYVGDLERMCYIKTDSCVPLPAGALAKFDTLAQQGVLHPIYDNAGVVIYQVTSSAGQAGS